MQQNKSYQKAVNNVPANQTKKTYQDEQKLSSQNNKDSQKKKPVNRKAYQYRGYSGNIRDTKKTDTDYSTAKSGQKAQEEAPNILSKFLPESLYNPHNKKLFGLITAEDLLLIALIFIFADSDREDSGLMCLAILYLLISDYLNFSEFLSS